MRRSLLFAVFVLCAALSVALPAGAQDILVNTLAGDNDGSCDPGGTGPTDDCSLLEALDLANGDSAAEVIAFSVSGVITAEDTPTILTPVTLDGTTAPGGPRSVIINREVPQQGVRTGVLVSGTAAAGSIVRGLTFTRTLLGSLGNTFGVRVDDTPDVQIGGSVVADGNEFIDTDFSIQIHGATATGAIIRGNVITGNNQGEFDYAITIDGAPSATIGGTGENDGNTVSEVEFGIFVAESASSGFSIVGNRLTNVSEDGIRLVTGMTSGSVTSNVLINSSEGIVTESVSGIVIGGTGEGEGNVITGGSTGMRIGGNSINLDIVGNEITGSGSFGIRVQGTMSAGNEILGNMISQSGFIGVAVDGAPNNVVGGSGAGEGNVIIDSDFAGVRLQFSSSAGARVIGNEITGESDYGVYVDGTSESVIGGTGNGEGNTISGAATGVLIWDTDLIENAILGNSITGSTQLGIDLTLTSTGDGVTPNDGAPDADNGPNGFQNFPVITDVEPGVEVAFSLASTPNTTFHVEAFASAQRNSSGFGPGERFLGSVEVTTDGLGSATGTVPATGLADGEWATMTATPLDGTSPTGYGGTSEFSEAARTGDPLPAVTLSVSSNDIDESGGTAMLTATLSAAADGVVTIALAYSGEAQQNVDFTGPGTITVQDGQIIGTATLTVLEDNDDESDETFVIAIASITGNAVDEPPAEEVTVTIRDDDGAAGGPGQPGVTEARAVPGLPWPAQLFLLLIIGLIGGRELGFGQVSQTWNTESARF